MNKIKNTEKLYKTMQIFHRNFIFLWYKWNILNLSPLFLFLNFTLFPHEIIKFKLYRFNMYLNYTMTLWIGTNHCNGWYYLLVMCYLFIIVSKGPVFFYLMVILPCWESTRKVWKQYIPWCFNLAVIKRFY